MCFQKKHMHSGDIISHKYMMIYNGGSVMIQHYLLIRREV